MPRGVIVIKRVQIRFVGDKSVINYHGICRAFVSVVIMNIV